MLQEALFILHRNRGIGWSFLPVALFLLTLVGALLLYGVVPDDLRMAVLLLPIALVLGLIILVRPEMAMYLSIAYIPFESSKFVPLDLPGGLSIAKVLGAILIAAFLFNVVFRGYPFRLLDDPEDLTVFLFAATLLLSGVSSEYPDKNLSATIRMFRMFAFYFAVKNLLTTPRHVRNLLWIIYIGGVVAAWWGLKEYFDERAVRVHDIRVRGVLMNPNEYAMYAVFIVAVGVYMFPLTRSRVLKLLIAVGIASNVVAIVLSASRGGLLALGLVSLLYILAHPQRWRLLAAAVLLLIVTFPLWPASVVSRFGLGEAPGDNVYSATAEFSTMRRLGYIEFSKTLIEDAPLTGIGYGTFSRYYPRSKFALLDNPLTNRGISRVAHNTYLEIVVGAGFIGLAAYVLYLVVVLRDLYVAGWHTTDAPIKRAAGRAFFLGLLGFLVSSTFLSIEHFNFLWMTGALASALRYMIFSERASTTAATVDSGAV